MSRVGKSFWESLPLGRDVSLLNVDGNGLAAFNKPAGTLSHPNQKSDQPLSLLDAHYALDGEFYQWKDAGGADRKLWLLNRLDSATSGVIRGRLREILATGSSQTVCQMPVVRV